MKLFKWVDSVIKTMRWYHISLIKLSTAAIVLMIAKLRDGILYLDWYWYLVIGLVLMMPLLVKMFCNRK